MGLALLLAIGLAVLWVTTVAITVRTLRRPPRRTYAWAVSKGIPGDPSELPSPRNFHAWSLRDPVTETELPLWTIDGNDPAGPIVVFVHGWGESRLSALARLNLARCSKFVAIDLPGHGESGPGPTRLGINEHLALTMVVRAVQGAGPVVLWGFSLGSGVCLACAAECEVSAVIAESPYRLPHTPAGAVLRLRAMPRASILGTALWIVGLLASGPRGFQGFDRAGLAAKLACPLLVLHGSDDQISPIADGRQIAAAGRGSIMEIAGAGHFDVPSHPSVPDAIDQFLQPLRRPSGG